MTDGRKQLGRLGEDLAAAQLEGQGWEIIARNWRTRRGEIDIIAKDNEWLVFVEVKTRRAARQGAPYLGRPEDAVTARKQLQLAYMVEAYLSDMPWDGPWRVDVIALEVDSRDCVARCAHYRDALAG